MSSKTTQRWTGALVLLLILALLFPFVFDGAGYHERKEAQPLVSVPSAPTAREPMVMPERRALPSLPAPVAPLVNEAVMASGEAPVEVAPVASTPTPVAPSTAAVAAPVAAAPVAPVPVAPRPAADTQARASVEPQLDADQLPAAWALQLASFRQEANARELRTRLINSGYRVYIRHGDDVVRVFVGPEMDRSRLESLKGRLKDEYGLEGMIVRFTTQ